MIDWHGKSGTYGHNQVIRPTLETLRVRAFVVIGVVVLAIGLIALPFLMMAALIVDPILKIAGCRGCIRGKQLIFDRTSFERRKLES